MNPSITLGVLRLARFNAAGLAEFNASPAALLNALTPWLAFALVGSVLTLLDHTATVAAGELLASVIAVTAPVVVSETLCAWWGRQAAWWRYAVAITWCQWLMPVVLLAAIRALHGLVGVGVPDNIAKVTTGCAVLIYVIALQLFVARHALAIAWPRATALVVAVNVITGTLALGPTLLFSDGAR